MEKRNKLIFLAIFVAVLIVCLGISGILLQNTFLTDDEIEECREDVNLILSGKDYDSNAYRVEKMSNEDITISFEHNKVQSVDFYVSDGEVINYTVITNEFTVVINYIFVLLTVICVGCGIVILVGYFMTLKFERMKVYQNSFN